MDTEKLLREIRIAVGALFIGVLCVRVATLPDFTITTNKANVVLDKASKLEDSTQRFGHQVSMDYYDPDNPTNGFYRQIQDDLYYSAQSSKSFTSAIADTNANINGGLNSKKVQVKGLLPTVTELVTTADGSVKDLTKSIGGLASTAQDALVPLKQSFDNIDILSSELADELNKGGDVSQTFIKLNAALDNANTLLSNPGIAKTLANVGDTSTYMKDGALHADSIITTVDDVTLPWRKKVGQLKLILERVGQLLKFTVPLAK